VLGQVFWVRRGIKPQREYTLSNLCEDSVAQRGRLRERGDHHARSSVIAFGGAPAALQYSPRSAASRRASVRLKHVHRENSQTKSYQDNAFAVRPET
jgi:hypothetical protein